MFDAFPMILIPVAIYNLAAFGSMAADQHDMAGFFAQNFTIPAVLRR